MSSCPTHPQPPDIEELCKLENINKPRLPQRKRTMTLQERELRQLRSSNNNNNNNNNNNVRGLPRSVSDVNVVAFCTCQQSKDFPYCDNTHSIFNKATNSNMQPLYVAFVEGDNKCSDCSGKDKHNRLSHSMDHTIPINKRNQLKLHTSADKVSTCCCKSKSSSNEPLTQTNTIEKTQPATTNITPNHSSPSSSPTPIETPPISTPTTIQQTNETTSTTIQQNNEPNKCNTTPTKVYTPSSMKSRINQNNIITRAEVAEHASQNDLWMIIKGNVYDITDYVQYHPGGTRALVKFAGQDGTENVHYHSSKMLELLNSHYYIGKLPKHEGGGGGCIIS